jgi:hypothetical protein
MAIPFSPAPFFEGPFVFSAAQSAFDLIICEDAHDAPTCRAKTSVMRASTGTLRL